MNREIMTALISYVRSKYKNQINTEAMELRRSALFYAGQKRPVSCDKPLLRRDLPQRRLDDPLQESAMHILAAQQALRWLRRDIKRGGLRRRTARALIANQLRHDLKAYSGLRAAKLRL
ncbi:MAG: hypothetical protein AB7G06_09415 [Bdellovibrionales bacterium]